MTIEADDTIKFDNGRNLQIRGVLDAQGTAASGILFTRRSASDEWSGIKFHSASSGTLQYCTVEYATYSSAYGVHAYSPLSLSLSHCTLQYSDYGFYLDGDNDVIPLTLTDNTIRDNTTCGIYISNTASPALSTANTIQNSNTGVWFRDCSNPSISNQTITGNTGDYGAIYMESTGEFTIGSGNTITGNFWGLTMNIGSYPSTASSGNIPTSGNTNNDGIQVYGGSTSKGVIWRNVQADYIITRSPTISSGGTLTIEADDTVRFDDGEYLPVYGTLNAQGTAASGILFTRRSASDEWSGIRFRSGSSGTLQYCTVEYATYSSAYGVHAYSPLSLSLSHCTLDSNHYGFYGSYDSTTVIEQCVISHNASHGVYLSKSSTTIDQCIISNNNSRGMYLSNSSPIVHSSHIVNNGSYGVYCTGSSQPAIGDDPAFTCYLHGNGDYDIYVNSPVGNDVWARYNCWGTEDSTQIAARIFDHEDDSTKGTTYFMPPCHRIHHNVGVTQILAPPDTVNIGTVVIPQAVVENFGDSTETFPVIFSIGTSYSDTVSKTLVSGAADTVDFEPWTASTLGTYIIECYTALIGDENPGNDTLFSSVTVIPGTTLCTLSVADAWGAPGGTGNLVEIELVNTVPVGGIQFIISDIPNWLTATGGSTTVRTSGFTVSIADNDTCVMVLLFSTSGDSILPGSGPVLELVYDVDASAPAGSTIIMDLHDVIVSDPNAQPIEVEEQDGLFTLGMKGDVNGDGEINILDIIRKVNIILGNPPPPTEYELWAADDNCDGNVNILDIILEVKCILSGECDFCNGDPLAKNGTQPARMGVGQVAYPAPDEVTVPIGIENPVPMAGLQLTLEFDPDRLVPGEVQLTELTDGFTLASRAESGKLTLLLYSTTGELIPAGSGSVVEIPFKLTSRGTDGGELHFEEAILAGENGGSIPVITKDVVLPAPLPKTYALSQNYPNPFNPETNIGYQLPVDSWVTLNIYNISGQLVRTLVDEKRKAGRYAVTWDGCDSFGKPVSSGIYLYRLQAGGFTQTKRMILIK